MKKILTLILASASLTFVGCASKTLEDVFSKETYVEDIATLSEKKLLTAEDSSILTSYITANEYDSLVDAKAYGEILAAAKKEIEEKERIAKERADRKKILDESLTVQVSRKYTKDYMDEGYVKNFLLLDIDAQNNTDKQISGFTVIIHFKGADGETFYANEWPISQIIQAKSKKTVQLSTGEVDNTNPQQSKLNMADISKIKIEYEITQLLYDDGTSLSLD
jgi:hypothetical protein